MINLKLSPTEIALIDEADKDLISPFKWYPSRGKWGTYAKAHVKGFRPRRKIYMHRLIMGLSFGDKRFVDHVNHNGLDNRRCNLRICSNAQNQYNQLAGTGTSRFKGVCWFKALGKWHAQIKLNYRTLHVGYFDDEIEAARAYDNAAIFYYGPFALLNFKRGEQ